MRGDLFHFCNESIFSFSFKGDTYIKPRREALKLHNGDTEASRLCSIRRVSAFC